jgi:hypothetical protein
MQGFFIAMILVMCVFTVARVNELHDKMDRAGVALAHATVELDEASDFLHKTQTTKQIEEKKIDEELKAVPEVELKAVPEVEPKTEAAPQPDPVAPAFDMVGPPPPPAHHHRHKRGPFHK